MKADWKPCSERLGASSIEGSATITMLVSSRIVRSRGGDFLRDISFLGQSLQGRQPCVPNRCEARHPARRFGQRLGRTAKTTSRPIRCRSTSPARPSTARCLITAGRETGMSVASVVAVPRPRPASASSRRQRVGSASAVKTSVRVSFTPAPGSRSRRARRAPATSPSSWPRSSGPADPARCRGWRSRSRLRGLACHRPLRRG